MPRTLIRRVTAALVLAAAVPLAACSSGKTPPPAGASGGTIDNAKIAFLMPDQASTRYEQHDAPGFKAE